MDVSSSVSPIKPNLRQFNTRDFTSPSQVHQPQKIASTVETDTAKAQKRPTLKIEEIAPNTVPPGAGVVPGFGGGVGVVGFGGGRVGPEPPFWADDPNILLVQITALFPTQTMTYNEQLNAISRLVILFSVLFFFVLKKPTFLIVGAFTLFLIWVVQHASVKKRADVEGLENPVDKLVPSQNALLETQEPVFDTPSVTNPFSNVLLSDYVDNPQKAPAPPIENPKTQDTILKNAKELVARAHPTLPDIADRLFSNLGDNYEFERAMRPFHSSSSTTIPNDQQAFTDFCYGDMISCKEGNLFACARNLTRHQNM